MSASCDRLRPHVASSFFRSTLAALCVVAGCAEEQLGSYELYRQLAQATRIEVVVPERVELAPLSALAARLESSSSFTVEFERADDLDPSAARLWIADQRVAALGPLFQLSGVRFDAGTGAVWFDGRRYLGPREALQLTVADPLRPGWPVTVVLASDASIAARFVSDLRPTWKPGYRCWRDGRIEREGLIGDNATLRPSSASDALAVAESWASVTTELADLDVVAHGPVDAQALAEYLECLSLARQRVVACLGETRERGLLHVWPNHESFSAVTGSRDFGCLGPAARETHAVVARGVLHDAGRAYALALARSIAGPARDAWVEEALADAATGTWRGVVPLREWGERLARRSAFVDWLALLDPAFVGPEHIVGAQRAIVFDELLRVERASLVQRAWHEGAQTLVGPAADAAHLVCERAERSSASAPTRRERALARKFRAGMHVLPAVDEDGRSPFVYGSQACFEALAQLRALGFDTVAFRPSYTRAPRTTWWPRAERVQRFDSATTQDQLIASVRYARELGLEVMLAPQLLEAPAANLADVTMSATEARAASYFDDLQALLVDTALVAELCDVEIVCLGSELNLATNTFARDIESGWTPPQYMLAFGARLREALLAVRAVYDGALTYAASGGDQLDIDLWSELDFVGLDLYRVLTADPQAPSRPDLKLASGQLAGSLKQCLDYAAQFSRPCLITEVGFGPTDDAALDPRLAPGSYDVLEQRELYEALRSALRSVRRQFRGPAGVFVWCWSIDAQLGQGVDRSFTPQNRPAAELLPTLFAER